MSMEDQRSYFPTLHDGLVYLDTAASSLTPTPVIEAMDRYYRQYRASAHRGLYAEAERATEAYEGARAQIASFIKASPEEVIFTSGATAAANMLVYALEHTLELREGDEIVTTVMEHHAMFVPLQELAKRKGLALKYAQLGKDFMLDTGDLEELITDRTRIVAALGASNVTGSIVDLKNTSIHTRVTTSIHDSTHPVIIRDATALIGHAPVTIGELGADFVFFSGHKICGPTGVGILWCRRALLADLEPGFYGGGMVQEVTLESASWVPGVERFEPGTPNIAGAIGLGSAVAYLAEIGLDVLRKHVHALTAYAYETLGALPGVTLYAASPDRNVGIISFSVEGIHPHDVAQIAGNERVAVRAGHHCALPLHQALGVLATTRASIYLYTVEEDIDALARSIRAAQKTFHV